MRQFRLFSSKVEARLHAIFFLCSAILFALLSFVGVEELESQTLSQAKEQLRLKTKKEALNVLARLTGIESQLRHYVDIVPEKFARYPELLDGVLSVKQLETEAGSRSSLLFKDGAVYLTVNTPDVILEATIELAYVWPDYGLGTEHSLQCIHIDGASFACHSPAGTQRRIETIAVQWDLFLSSAFSIEQLFTMHSQIDKSVALKPIALAVEIVPYIVAVACLLLAFFSIRMLRYRLLPLQSLKRATQRLESGDFRASEVMQSGDEFESLGHAFRKMTQRLGESFQLVQDLGKVDRLILSSANFSEVVQEVLAIGQTENAKSCSFQHWNDDESTEDRHYLLSFEDGQFREAGASEKLIRIGERDDYLSYAVFMGDKRSGLLCIEKEHNLVTQSEIDRFIKMADMLSVAITHFQHTRERYNQANFDSLTGLSNRYAFRDHVRLAIEQRRRDGHQGVVIFVDLDRFKQVNDTEGHKAGDRMLRLITERISACIRKSDVFARIGVTSSPFCSMSMNR